MNIPATDKARVALIVAFSGLLAPYTAKAQSFGTPVVAEIPFAFHIGSDRLPPGRYRFEMRRDGLLWIDGDSDSAVMLVLRQSTNRPSPDSAVVFHHYGDQYFLREVRTAGDDGFLWSDESKAERRAKLEQEAANPNSGPREDSKVEVALLAPPR